MLVLAIDVGIKNLALCAMDTELGVVHWANEALSERAYQPMHNVQYVHEFIDRNRALFEAADQVVVEKQMRVNMRIIEAVIHSRFYAKCKIVHARTIKTALGLGRGNYVLNKKAAVDYVQDHLQKQLTGAPHGKPETHWQEHFAKAKKRDDLADAYVMALFFSGGSKVDRPCATVAQARTSSQAALEQQQVVSMTSESCIPASCLPCGSASVQNATPSMPPTFSSSSHSTTLSAWPSGRASAQTI